LHEIALVITILQRFARFLYSNFIIFVNFAEEYS
jgi:hypothetical protein